MPWRLLEVVLAEQRINPRLEQGTMVQFRSFLYKNVVILENELTYFSIVQT